MSDSEYESEDDIDEDYDQEIVELSEEEDEIDPTDEPIIDNGIINKNIIIVQPQDRKTSDILSMYEQTETISIRATAISRYNDAMVDPGTLTDPVKIAEKELMMRRCPLILRRVVGEIKRNNDLIVYVEEWSPNEMIFSKIYTS